MVKTEILLKLLKENPDLPILPLVDSEIIGEDHARYIGSIGNVCVGEYAVYDDRAILDRAEFKKSYYANNEDWLSDNVGYKSEISETAVNAGRYTPEEFVQNVKARKKIDDFLENAAEAYFKKAIILYVDLPE